MNLYLVTKHDDHSGESKEQLSQNSDVEKLKKIGNEYAQERDAENTSWQLLGLPTMGDHEIPKNTIEKQMLKITESEYLLIDE